MHDLSGEARDRASGASVHVSAFENVEDTIPALEDLVCIRSRRQFICGAGHAGLRWSNASFSWTVLDTVLE
jgi:hypothetical protein